MPNVIQLGPLSLNAPIVYFIVAFAVWLSVLRLVSGKLDVNYSWIRTIADGAILTGAAGARLTFALWYWESYVYQPWTILYFWQPGYSLFGGTVVATLFACICFWRKRQSLHWRQPAAFFSLAILVLASSQGALLIANSSKLTIESPLTPARMVPFEFTNIEKENVSFSDYEGMPLVLNFWATWCPPCRREMPLLERSYERYLAEGVAIIAVNVDESHNTVSRYLTEQGLTLPVWQNGKHSTAQLFNYINGQIMPTTLFIHPDGRIESTRIGELSAATLQLGIEAIQ